MRVMAWGILIALVPLGPLAGAVAEDGSVELVVGFYDMPDLARGDRYQGARVESVDAPLRFASVATDDAASFTTRARSDERVRYVEPAGEIHALFSPNDPRYTSGEQYGPRRMNAAAAWDKTIGSTSAQVCIVDSGVRRTHEDIASERYVGGIDYVEDDGDPNDGNGHGTFTTAIALARIDNGRGIAGMASASWRHARVLDAGGSGAPADAGSAMRWCADSGAHIISMSLGTSSDVTAMRDGATYAWGKGALLLAASGNDGCTNCVLFPARYPEVIAVGCTSSADARCSFSNGGPELDVVAPGESIVSAYRNSDTAYASGSGTSASAPHVAGALALLKSYAPGMSNSAIRARLEGSARDLGAAGFDNLYGHGLVLADALLPNTAPSVTMECAPGTAAVYRTITCTLTPSDIEGHGVWMSLDWGDGTTARVPASGVVAAGTPVSATHRYEFSGSHIASALPSDDAPDSLTGTATTFEITTGANTAPRMASIDCAPDPATLDVPTTCTFRADDDSDGVAYLVDWGDGATSRVPAEGYAAPGVVTNAAHAYGEVGLYDIYVSPIDDALPPATGEAALEILEVRDCSVLESGSLALGAAGVEIEGTTKHRIESIDADCQGLRYRLQATSSAIDITFSSGGTTVRTEDVNVCWYQGPALLACHDAVGDESNIVPGGADAAEIILFAGASARYTLAIPDTMPG